MAAPRLYKTMSIRTSSIFLTFALATLSAGRLPLPVPAQGFADVVAKSVPSVVRILTTRREAVASSSPAAAAFGPPTGAGKRVSGEGSGVIVTAAGHILTNQHVIEGATKITVQLADDREFPARLVAADAPTDLAVLKIESGPLPALSFGDSSSLRVGDYVLAVGNPFGVGTTVTMGIVSAMSAARPAEQDEDLIQTDAAINPGNSGGPLLNTSGEMVGINTAIVSPSGVNSGVGLAIPASVARRVMAQLLSVGHVERGYLGLGLQPMSPELTEALNASRSGGALITDVTPSSPAAEAGLRKGDVVLALNGRAIRDFPRLRFHIAGAQPGASVRLTISREGEEQTFTATLAQRPASPSAPPASPPASEDLRTLPGAIVTELNEEARTALKLSSSAQGVLVTAVDPDGDSAAAGLRPGDVIVSANRRAVLSLETLTQALATLIGKPALLEVNRRDGPYFIALSR